MRRRLRVRLAMLALSSLLLAGPSGCGFRDIDKRFFVVAMGVDPAEQNAKGFKITLRLAVPSPKVEPGAGKNQIVSVEATSIAEAVRLMKAHVDKELDFGHCKLYLLGEKLVDQDYTTIMRWLTRRRDVQSTAYMAVGQPDANSVLQIAPPAERYPGNTIFLMFGKDGTQSSYLVRVYLFDFIRRIEEKGIDPVLPVIRGENEGYVITRLALMDKSKRVLTLNPGETETYDQIRNRSRKSTVTALKDGVTLVLSVSSISSSYRIVTKGAGDPVIKLHLNVSGIFEEAPLGIYNEDWKALEATFNRSIKTEFEKLLVKVQKTGTDPFGFGLRYRATHAGNAKTWADWLKLYPKLTFDVTVRTTIDGTGMVK